MEEATLKRETEMADTLLPWTWEQKVAMVLNPIKIPVVIVVAVLGCWVEHQLHSADFRTWKAPVSRLGPTCYVHMAQNTELLTADIRSVNEAMNQTLYPIASQINAFIVNHTHCFVNKRGQTECNFFELPKIFDFKVDHCGIMFDNETNQCKISPELQPLGEGKHGIAYRFPFLPFSLIWAIYKILFLPFHPVDRFVNMVEGYPQPMSEPTFKLLIEPYFQIFGPVLNMFSKIGKVIRYSLLPNSMMLPLFSMARRSQCSHYLHYDMDTVLAPVIYGFVILDLIIVCLGFVAGKFVFGGVCVGTWKYRLYKLYWSSTLLTALVLFFADIFIIFNVQFWEGLSLWINLTLVFDPSFNFVVDFCQKLIGLSVLLDTLQMAILIWGIVLPLLVPALAPLVSRSQGTNGNSEHEEQNREEYRPVLTSAA